MKNINKILIISLNYLGDVLMTLPLHYNLKKKYPNKEIHICIGKKAAGLQQLISNVDKWVIRSSNINFFTMIPLKNKIKKNNYDMVILYRNAKYTHKLAKISGAKRVISTSEPLLRNLKIEKAHNNKKKNHVSDTSELILRKLGIKNYEYNVFYKNIKCNKNYKNNDYAAFLPGTTRKAKKWDIKNWIKLGKLIKKRYNYKIYLLGSKNDNDIKRKFKKYCNYRYVDIVGETSLKELYCILKNSKFIVSVDNGAMHMADYMDVNLFSLFGSTDPEIVGPKSKKSKIIESDYNCKYNYCGNNRCKNNKFCMDFISVDKVWVNIKNKFE